MHIIHMAPYFRDRKIRFRIYPDDNADSHNYQTDTEKRIYLSYDLINRNERLIDMCRNSIKQ